MRIWELGDSNLFMGLELGILESSLRASALRSSGARFQGLVTSSNYRFRVLGLEERRT